MTIQDVINRHGIKEVVHFTTHRGLVGILHSGTVKSRQRLPGFKDLEYIYEPNAKRRLDQTWLDYVNLSISRINATFFGHSCRWRREEDLWWCILAFDPGIMLHHDVWFTTTNNIYPACQRGCSAIDLERLFAPAVPGRYSSVTKRSVTTPPEWTTCEQAEVLYPGELSIDHLRRIYVSRGEDQDEVYAQMAALNTPQFEVIVASERFFGHTGD